MKVAPARTRATRWGALTARQRSCADSISLNAMASPAAREPGALGDLGPVPDRGEGRLDRVRRAQVHPVLARVVEERQQLLRIVGDLRGGLGELRAVGGTRRPSPRRGHAACPRRPRSPPGPSSPPGARTSAARPARCAVLWNQQRPSLACGNTSRSPFQKPSAPSPTASTGARIPRRAQSRSRSAHDSADSRYPSASAMSSLRPSARTPIITSRHSLCSSSRMFTWIPSAHR